MGTEIQREGFTKADFDAFGERLRAGLVALEQVLARPGFGEGERTIGAELEMVVVDGAGRPLAVGDEVLQRLGDERVTHEMGAFNVELNTDPVALAGTPFSRLGADMAGTLARIRGAAGAEGGRLAIVSVLPTFRQQRLPPVDDHPAAALPGAGGGAAAAAPGESAHRHRRRRSADDRGRRRGDGGGEHVVPDPPARRAARVRGVLQRGDDVDRRRRWRPRGTRRRSWDTGSGTRRGRRCSSRRETTGPTTRRSSGRPGSVSAPGGCATGPTSCSRRASRSTSRSCRWSATRIRSPSRRRAACRGFPS